MLALVPGGVSASMRDAGGFDHRSTGLLGCRPSPSSLSCSLPCWSSSAFPQRFYQTFVLEHRYGLSAVPLRVWIGDHVKGLALSLTLVLGRGRVRLFRPRAVAARGGGPRPRWLARCVVLCWPG